MTPIADDRLPFHALVSADQGRPIDVYEQSAALHLAILERTGLAALGNDDYDQFGIMLEKVAEDMIVYRHQANGMLFDAYFEKPGFREQLLEYLDETYHKILNEGAV